MLVQASEGAEDAAAFSARWINKWIKRRLRMLKRLLRPDILRIAGLTAVLFLLCLINALAARRAQGQPSVSEGWVYETGDWYYEIDGARVRSQWVEDHNYFVDEAGRMVEGEWIYERLDEAGYHHSKAISAEDFSDINMERLSYVGHDGRIIRNKNIYFTPFKFDEEGICSVSAEDVTFSGGRDHGIEGLRRYVIFNGGYKEYY